MSAKEYIIVRKKFIKSREHYVISRHKVSCIGGDNMPEEKPKMVFVDTSTIPVSKQGKRGRNWLDIFSQIPKDKAWIVTEKDKTYKISGIKVAVTKINKDAKKTLYDAKQRVLSDGTKAVYVTIHTEEKKK